MSISVEIKKRYKGFALEIGFQSEGGLLGILGASGSGKTQTLKCIAGLVKPDEGRIEVNGRVLFDSAAKVDIPPQKRRVGYLFQSYALFPHMTVEQNISCVVEGDKQRKKQRALELLERFHMGGLEARYPKELSGGQQQRAALVRILAYEPELLLLDEPFAALDTNLKEKLQVETAQLLEEHGGDALLVTHNRDEAYRLCSQLMALSEGGVVASGGTKELFADPGSVEAARLTGCKNISQAKQTGEHTVHAEEWGIELRVEGQVPASLTHVGIRAHDFYPAERGGENTMRFLRRGQMENPFEWSVIFQNADAERAHEIWWMYSKALGIAEMPQYLKVSPGHILLLAEDNQWKKQ